eukprot:SAG11_NODE_13563_length_649_cov_1.750909_1_plen_78_part_00
MKSGAECTWFHTSTAVSLRSRRSSYRSARLRQKYEYVETGQIASLREEMVGDSEGGGVRLIRCLVDRPLNIYLNSKG